MKGKALTIGLAAVLASAAALFNGTPEAASQRGGAGLTIQPVKDNLYNIVGDGGNVAALVTDEGVVLIDDKYDRDFDPIVESVRSVTRQPIRYVVNTHYHEDHSGGNVGFLSVAEVISTQNARANILAGRQTGVQGTVVPARITFTDQMSIFLGGYEIRARHFGRGHTDTDAIIYFPELRTVHMGDMMAGTTPLIDYNGGGSLVEWTDTVDAMLGEFDFDTVIPGHGAVTDLAGLRTYRENVIALRSRATELVRSGRSQEEVAAALGMEYPAYAPGSRYLEWTVPGMMTELR